MSRSNADRPRVGVLALTLELYEALAPKLRLERESWLRREAIPALEEFAEVIFKGAVFQREDIEDAVREMEGSGADALVVVLLTYSPSQIALPALKRTSLPILVWNTQELYAVTEDFTPADMTSNHGVHGTQDLCNVLLRSGVSFEYVTSHLHDEGALAEIQDFLSAAKAVRRLQNAKLGLIGYPFPGMGDFALDTTDMAAVLGCTWRQLSVEEYVERAGDVPNAEADALVSEYRTAYKVAPNVSEEDLNQTARVELAIRGMVRDYRLDGLTYQFTAFGEDERSPTLPFVAASRLMAEGIGFGGEGDLIACAGTMFLNVLQPPAGFTEIFTVDFAHNGLFLSHMGEANVAMARPDIPIRMQARKSPITRTRYGQLALVSGFLSSPATLFALTLGPNGWRMIAGLVEVVDFGPLADMASPHAKVIVEGDVRDFLTRYAKAGGPHHNGLCFGDGRRRIRMAASMLGIEYCEV